jgi:hypothetical protein
MLPIGIKKTPLPIGDNSFFLHKKLVSTNSASLWIWIFANHVYAMLYSQSVHSHIRAVITLTPEINCNEIDRGSAQAFVHWFA